MIKLNKSYADFFKNSDLSKLTKKQRANFDKLVFIKDDGVYIANDNIFNIFVADVFAENEIFVGDEQDFYAEIVSKRILDFDYDVWDWIEEERNKPSETCRLVTKKELESFLSNLAYESIKARNELKPKVTLSSLKKNYENGEPFHSLAFDDVIILLLESCKIDKNNFIFNHFQL